MAVALSVSPTRFVAFRSMPVPLIATLPVLLIKIGSLFEVVFVPPGESDGKVNAPGPDLKAVRVLYVNIEEALFDWLLVSLITALIVHAPVWSKYHICTVQV